MCSGLSAYAVRAPGTMVSLTLGRWAAFVVGQAKPAHEWIANISAPRPTTRPPACFSAASPTDPDAQCRTTEHGGARFAASVPPRDFLTRIWQPRACPGRRRYRRACQGRHPAGADPRGRLERRLLGSERGVRTSPSVFCSLRPHHRAEGLGGGGGAGAVFPFSMVFEHARAKAALPDWATPHDLRHFYVSREFLTPALTSRPLGVCSEASDGDRQGDGLQSR